MARTSGYSHVKNMFSFFKPLEDVSIDRYTYVCHILSTTSNLCVFVYVSHGRAHSCAIRAALYGSRYDLYLQQELVFHELIELRSQQDILQIDIMCERKKKLIAYDPLCIYRFK